MEEPFWEDSRTLLFAVALPAGVALAFVCYASHGPLRGRIQRLKRAFWVEGVAGAARKAEEINRSQEPYWNIVRLLPPLPDFVFAFKRFKRPRELPRKLETLQPTGCSSAEQ